MSATSAALLGTLIGAITALASGMLTNLVALRNERSRQRAAKDAADVEILRQHTAVAFTEMFALNHAANWIAWFAEHAPRTVNQQMTASFDAETSRAYPELLGATAMVAALHLDVYRELRRLQGEVFRLWERAAIAAHRLDTDPNDAMQALRGCLPIAAELEGRLGPELARIMEMAGSEPRR
jgi:hypothetical protein